MWRFIFVTFAFLGSAFYFLSGGDDYAPAPNSFQAHAQAGGFTLFARPDPASPRAKVGPEDAAPETSVATGPDTASPALASLSGLSLAAKAQPGAVRVQLASVDSPRPPQAQTITAAPGPDTGASDDIAMTIASNAAVTSPIGDVRHVIGASVNMRSGPGTKFSRIARLSGGTPVAVLRDPGDGWLKIRVVETGRVGWMADWLVAASAN